MRYHRKKIRSSLDDYLHEVKREMTGVFFTKASGNKPHKKVTRTRKCSQNRA